MQPCNDGVEFRFGPNCGVLLALERNHAHLLFRSEQEPVQFRLVVHYQMPSERALFKAQFAAQAPISSVGTRLNPFSTWEMKV